MIAAEAQSGAPVLTLQHLAPEIERLHRSRHRTRRTCLFAALAEPVDEEVEVTAKIDGEAVRFGVRQVASELELRLALLEESRDAVIYLVPFARQLPRDLAAKFAKGAVVAPRIEHQLPARFGARRATPRLLGSALIRVARLEGIRHYAEGLPVGELVDLDDAWLLMLQAHAGLQPGQVTNARLFEAFLSDDADRGSRFASLLAQVPGARSELVGVLERRLGAAGPVLLDAWLEGKSGLVGAAALVGEGARSVLLESGSKARADLLLSLESTINGKPDHPLRSVLEKQEREGLGQVLLALSDLVALSWPGLRASRPAKASSILTLAEKLLGSGEAREAAKGSHRLPFSFDRRVAAFSDGLRSIASGAGETSLDELQALAQSLLRHERAERWSSLGSLVDMSLRLAAFLGTRPPPARSSAADEVASLAAWQAEHGGWLDFARSELRGRDAGALEDGVLAILERADAVRDELNARFAKAYARTVEHKGGRKNLAGVVPIESALSEFGLRRAATMKELRFLVVCMDGMSWANLAELVSRSGSRLRSFVPLVPTGSRTSRPPPVIAQIPTITRLSRTALFLGKSPVVGEPLDSGRDPDRFAKHPDAEKLPVRPVLWLKRDLMTAAGKLQDDVRKMVESQEAPVVGVVVNAIDDQLKGASQLRVQLTVEAIPVLDALLECAERVGRLVLLCSDHGNVPSSRFGPVVSSAKRTEGGARWRWLPAGEAPGDGEVVVPAGPLKQPGQGDQLVVPFDETTRYVTHLHAGEHGGLTLSEAIAPTVLLSPPGLVGAIEEERVFASAEIDAPAWWDKEGGGHRVVAEVATTRAPGAPVAPKTPKPSTRTGAMPRSLFPDDDRAQAIFDSELFQLRITGKGAGEAEYVRRGLRALLRNGGRLGCEAYAREIGIRMASRVTGFIAAMQEVMNVDQELVVRMDARRTQVELDIPLLERLFLGGDS